MLRRSLTDFAASLLVLLWSYAFMSKLFHFHRFVLQLHEQPFIQGVAGPVAVAVILGEVACVTMLLFAEARSAGLWLSFFLLSCFTLFIMVMLFTQSHLPCSCGGVLSSLSWRQHLLFNLAFLIITVIGIRSKRSIHLKKRSSLYA